MANIFKTTLKKDVIADIANNNVKEIRFPLTKFWATRLTDEYNLDDKTFTFKKYDSLELSSPSNKDTNGMTFVFEHVGTSVDGDEFVVEFKQTEDVSEVDEQIGDVQDIDVETIIEEDANIQNDIEDVEEYLGIEEDGSDLYNCADIDDIETIDNSVIFDYVNQWFDSENILDNLYEEDTVFATNARQIIVLPKGKILGFKKTLPVNNDAEVRIEFDRDEKVYFDVTFDIEEFKSDIYNLLYEIRKNNFLFVWKRYTGIFMDNDGGIYFGIKYSTRKSIGFNRKYNVQ